jgi:hypothetical protein
MRKLMTLAITASALAVATPAQAANLVVNGNFESGNVGFTSGYTYSPGSNTAAGEYTVTANPNSWNGYFVMAGDHTTGSGLMLAANGSQTLGTVVWQSVPIAILSGTNYFFEAFVMNLYAASPPNLTFTVSLDGGAELVLDTLSVPITTGVWNGLSTSFASGGATTANLYLRNAQTAFSGNDFAIDDIFLDTQSIVNPSAVPEPATWAMMLLGFGLVGSAMRRRSATGVSATV